MVERTQARVSLAAGAVRGGRQERDREDLPGGVGEGAGLRVGGAGTAHTAVCAGHPPSMRVSNSRRVGFGRVRVLMGGALT